MINCRGFEGSDCGLIEVLNQHYLGGAEEIHETAVTSQDSNQAPYAYKSITLPLGETVQCSPYFGEYML
jgi:hypothetical protein